jgi:hypothetical protein
LARGLRKEVKNRLKSKNAYEITIHVGSEVLSEVYVNRRFVRITRLGIQVGRMRQVKNEHQAGSKQSYPDLIDPEDEGDMFLRNVG